MHLLSIYTVPGSHDCAGSRSSPGARLLLVPHPRPGDGERRGTDAAHTRPHLYRGRRSPSARLYAVRFLLLQLLLQLLNLLYLEVDSLEMLLL